MHTLFHILSIIGDIAVLLVILAIVGIVLAYWWVKNTWGTGTIILLAVTALMVASAAIAAGSHVEPDPRLTPGVVRTDISPDKVCTIKWGKDERRVTAAMKRQVFEEYGYVNGNKDPRCPCEVDHLISRELGGADDIRNLWIQPYQGVPWSARVKDRYENFMHRQVCTGKMSLKAAQDEIRTDWIAGYLSHPELPRPAGAH